MSNNENLNKEKMIKELEALAEEVRKLKSKVEEDGIRPKRPIVIEFSGSPKSGKTTCINSLNMFLKRNGFTVEVVQERASVCPVSSKESPMFNIWTACSSLVATLGVLENDKKSSDCDVLILDRGIFDALCWFEWLSEESKMEPTMKQVTKDFLLYQDFVKKIDLVFSFIVDSKKSIEREHAQLLTRKEGSIMNELSLNNIHNAIQSCRKKYQNNFYKIIPIDTSELDQNTTGHRVTTDILTSLKFMLTEDIGYIEKEHSVLKQFEYNLVEYNDTESQFSKITFAQRTNVESNSSYIQPIPILILHNTEKTKVLVVKKAPKNEDENSPEKDKNLIYVGGHCRKEDVPANIDDFLTICRSTLKREVLEEIGLDVALENINPYLLYTPDKSKSEQHLAVCFFKEVDPERIKLRLKSSELLQTKGSSKSGRFITIKELVINPSNLESWSHVIIEKYFNVHIEKNKDTPLMNYI